MVHLVKHDLEFILKQIKIAEAHAAGGDLATLVAGYNGNDGLTQAHLLPYGLRTVDGSYNNLLPGRENWGASDQSFPGLFTPTYLNDADGDRYDFNPLPNVETWYTNNDYANAGTRTGSQPGPGSGTVIDADPRIISNLIVDQTLDNPAAIAAALTQAGMSGQALMTGLGEIVAAHKAVPSTVPAAPAAGAEPSLEYTAYATAKANLDGKLAQYGVEMDGNTVYLPNVSPDEGLSSPFNGWMTIFGQFFDHGLDLVAKGGNGTVYVPLAEDDPLYVPGGQNYIPLTRVTVNPGTDGRLGTADDGPGPKNLTTPWVDQNQTYASTASKQVFMREYKFSADTNGDGVNDARPIATGLLLEGSNGGLATWADIKAQAKNVLGIELTDLNVGNIPLIAADEYGNFIPGPNGYPQLVVGMGPDNTLGTADDVLREGNPAAPVSAQGVVLTGHAFLDDIAHAAVPVVNPSGALVQDTDSALGYANADGTPGPQGERGPSAYDNEMLDRHFIAGDGRANENIALTAVHQVFHSEHNRVVEMTKTLALESGDLAFLNEWLLVDVAAIPTTDAGKAALVWDGERLFQAGRFTNEMEYQHLVFEEFGRMMQPDIDVFMFEPSADINPSIAAEFAHVVYRFGHSMLRQDIAVIEMGADGKPVQDDITLFDGFLNPVMYDSLGDAEAASGAIIRGMSRQTGSEIDEFVTDVLRNQLLGIPLDLAAINIARGRDVGTPSLQTARERFFDATGDTLLKPYESWADFALNMKNPASIINFIAAYGTHETLTNTQANPKTVEQLREAATLLVLGGEGAPADRLDFLNATGTYAGGSLGGLNTVDFWMGGLAEKKMAFGGMLGSTFSFVFQMTMENLQDGDRFYYLSRAQGLNLLNELENNSFAELVMRNTDLGDHDSTALPGNLFSAFDMPQLEMDLSKQLGADPVSDDPFLSGFSKMIERIDANNDGVAENIRVNSNEHFVIGGTENNDVIVSGGGDDAIWGKGGDDTIEAGYGVDKVFGGEGDDIITNAGTDIGESDFLHGNEGNDVIHGGSGLSLIFGNQGSDFLVAGPDGKTLFGGTGNDFILGGTGLDVLHGNEGDDWIEGGDRFDTLAGENSELFFNSTIIGHDVLNGGRGDTDYDAESGDDIMFQNAGGIQRSNGMAGFDWAIHKGDSQGASSNLGIPIFETQEAFILRDRFDLVEGLSGWKYDDNLTGRITAVNTRAEIEGTAAIPGPNSPLDSYSNDLLAKNVALINGLAPLVAHLGAGIPVTKVVNGQTAPVLDANGVQERVIFSTADASDILLGGGASDVITGLAGNDIIDGDRWLNVRIRFIEDGVAYTTDGMEGLVYREVDYVNGAPIADAVAQFGGRELDALMFDRTINPGQLEIVREIVDGDIENTATDVAVYRDVLANYRFALNADGSLTVTHVLPVDPTDGPDPADPDSDDEENGEPGENEQENEAEGGEHNPDWDGVDRLFNMEKLRFSDGNGGTVEYFINQLPIAASGAPIIVDPTPTNGMVSPTEGQSLSISRTGNVPNGIADSNGLPTAANRYAYQWQVSENGGTTWTNVAGATGANFTPNDGLLGFGSQIGDILRVRVTFTDNAGHSEVLYSTPTGIVGDNWDAVPFLSNTFNGTNGDDIADGTSGLFGAGANDTLNGNGGNDILNGAGGSDTLNGGTGDDRLDGGAGTDTAVWTGSVGNFALGSSGTNLVVTDLTGAEGTDTLSTIETLRFAGVNYTVVAGTTANNANLNGVNGANGSQAVFGFAGADSLNGGAANDLLVGGQGNDTIRGDAGNDTIYWTAGDGRDLINGDTAAANIVGTVDTVKIVGDSSAETYRIYSRTAAVAAGITGLNADTEIVITRNGTNNASVIAELDNIEEIVINGRGGGDTFTPIGDFAGTSLLTSTITLEGTDSDDTVDISALSSAHRIVFRSNGGNDTIVGTLRAQDVIELPEGTLAADFAESTGEDGVTTLTDGTHTIRFVADGTPQLVEYGYQDNDHDGHDDDEEDEDEDEDDDHGSDHDDDDEDCDTDEDDHDDDDDGGPSVPSGSGHLVGTAGADVLIGTSAGDLMLGFAGKDFLVGGGGADVVYGDSGDDRIFGDADDDLLYGEDGDDDLYGGDGNDLLKGDAGDDSLFGGLGKDLIEGGADNDTVFGGGGDDIFKGTMNDGNDTYYGGDISEDDGIDTLNLSFLTSGAVVDLGTGVGGLGSAVSSQSGTDTLWGVENVVTGGGADRITMSNAVNIVDGGAGNDVFVFGSSTAAHGDTIRGFQTGDKIDLSGIDADSTTAGNQAFQLVAGQASTAPGQIVVTHETREDGEYTIVSGNTAGADNAPEFRISLSGNHTLTGSDFNL